jgi:ABC-type uncharacterized transport system substrate-binding protein
MTKKRKKAAATKKPLRGRTMAVPPGRHIGFLVGTHYPAWEDCINAFENELKSPPRNWVKGTDYTIEYHPASGLANFYTKIATDLAAPAINIIVTGGTGPTVACIDAVKAIPPTTPPTPPIPIVFATAADGHAMVTYALPNTNVCGISNDQALHVPDRLTHLRNNMPASFRRFGLIGNFDPDNPTAGPTNVTDEMTAVKLLAKTPAYGLTPLQSTHALNTVDDIPLVIADLANQGAQALYVCTDPFITANADILNQYAEMNGLRTMHAFKQNCGQRGTLFWGPKLEDMFALAADRVYQILNGTNTPAQIGVVSPAYPGSFESKPPGL